MKNKIPIALCASYVLISCAPGNKKELFAKEDYMKMFSGKFDPEKSFTGVDNGPHLEGGADPDYFNSNGDLKGYKRDMYEGDIRTPK